jgi:hypothetical protein
MQLREKWHEKKNHISVILMKILFVHGYIFMINNFSINRLSALIIYLYYLRKGQLIVIWYV